MLLPAGLQPAGLGQREIARGLRRKEDAPAVGLAGLFLALAGCGKKDAPTAPPDEPNTYPRPYPSE